MNYKDIINEGWLTDYSFNHGNNKLLSNDEYEQLVYHAYKMARLYNVKSLKENSYLNERASKIDFTKVINKIKGENNND